ncbi:MAG: hypothetical protein PHN47_01605 [Clostridia bacterium]|jgi:hypothetical protein|nr:hypothetical protein [Clostridia bacterium]
MMKYLFFLRLKMPENQWLNFGESHIIKWQLRDIIAASSNWIIMNEKNMGQASNIIPNLQKGIMELTQHPKDYQSYEIAHGLGTIQEVLDFYQSLLKDCRRYPYTELYGHIKA